MATRATYKIDRQTFYCHWDGYPTGAAQRLANMVAALTQPAGDDDCDCIDRRRGGMPFAFIRGNMDAEPTDDHDAHGDTEYRYTVRPYEDGRAFVVVQARAGDWRSWNNLAAEDLADWLNRQRVELAAQLRRLYASNPQLAPEGADPAAMALEAIPVMVRVAEEQRFAGRTLYKYATLDAATAIEARLRRYGESFREDNPNRAGYLQRADEWQAAITATVDSLPAPAAEA